MRCTFWDADVIAQQQDERYYYMHDGLASVRQRADANGQIATNNVYDPFGGPLAGGTVPNPYRFTGDAWDGEVELLYLRARYYQPGTGRFAAKDLRLRDVGHADIPSTPVHVQSSPVDCTDARSLVANSLD